MNDFNTHQLNCVCVLLMLMLELCKDHSLTTFRFLFFILFSYFSGFAINKILPKRLILTLEPYRSVYLCINYCLRVCVEQYNVSAEIPPFVQFIWSKDFPPCKHVYTSVVCIGWIVNNPHRSQESDLALSLPSLSNILKLKFIPFTNLI